MVTRAAGVAVHARRSGDGPPLVALHGFGERSETWAPIAPAITARGWQLVAPDLPGFGESERPGGVSYDHPVQAGRVLAALDELGVEEFALLGHSLGGLIALELAVAEPGRVRALVLEACAPPAARPPGRLLRRLARMTEDGRAGVVVGRLRHLLVVPGLGDLVIRAAAGVWLSPRTVLNYLGEAPGAAEALLRVAIANPSPGLAERLPGLALPVLVVWGRRDRILPARHRERLARALPGARLSVYAEAGHSPHAEAPERFAQEVTTFLGDRR